MWFLSPSEDFRRAQQNKPSAETKENHRVSPEQLCVFPPGQSHSLHRAGIYDVRKVRTLYKSLSKFFAPDLVKLVDDIVIVEQPANSLF